LLEVVYIGLTSASKIAHLLNPELFVMWERNIAKEYKVKISTKGYLRFLQIIQNKMKGAPYGVLKELCERCNKTLAKLVDEYYWIRTRSWL
jgi:hypothetical protein